MSRTSPITPADLDAQLAVLANELDLATDTLIAAERDYSTAKAEEEIALARARLDLLRDTRAGHIKTTVQEREDQATVMCEVEIRALAIAAAKVKAARAKVDLLRTQVDITRSHGTNMRAFVDTQRHTL